MLKFLHVTFLKEIDLYEQQTDMMSVFVAGYSGEALLLESPLSPMLGYEVFPDQAF